MIPQSGGRLRQFEKYVGAVFSLPKLLNGITDGRRDPDIPTFDVVNALFHAALFHAALFRIPSINALEGDLKEADFQKLLGYPAKQDEKAFSAEVIPVGRCDGGRRAVRQWSVSHLAQRAQDGAVLIAKKEGDEPLKEALCIWGDQPPEEVIDDKESCEQIELWDVRDIETLDTYKGKVRVVRGRVTKPGAKKPSTWCMLVTGKACKLSARQALAAARGRWHIENTGFNQWVSYWNLNHVFHHTANALLAILYIWMLAFNLLQLFIYRRLKRERRPKDPTDTIRHLVEVMQREVATLPGPIPRQEILAFI